MRKRTGVTLGALLLPVVSAVFADEAQDSHKDTYLFSQPYYVDQDKDRALFDDDGFGFRLGLGRQLSGGWYGEANLAYNVLETGIGGFTDYYQAHFGLDVAYRFGAEDSWRPFLLLGVGLVRDDVFPLGNNPYDDETSAFSNVGFGVVTPGLFGIDLKLRADARYVMSDFDAGFEDGHFSIGFEVPLGRKTEVITKTVTKEVVREVPVVNADSDNDGVIDGVDRCPNTLRNARIDQYGCVVKKQTVKLEGINFRTGSADLTGDSVESLSEIAAFLTDQEDVRVEIAGHTDATGSAAFNQRLSQQRAESVRLFLIRAGVDPIRLHAAGYGELQPVASNENSAGRAKNRRVEFRILN